MGLIPTEWREFTRTIPGDIDPTWWSEIVSAVYVKTGFHRDPGTGDEIILEQTIRTHNFRGRILREDVETITVEAAGCPPSERLRVTKSSVWLPKINHQRRLMEVERERTVYWPFTPMTSGETLGATRYIDAYAIYTEQATTIYTPSEAAKAKLEDMGFNTENMDDVVWDIVLSTGRMWTDAQKDNSITQDATTRQTTKWVENIIMEEDIVEEEPDKYTILTVRKNALNPADVQLDGPRFVRKHDFSYRFPFPIDPPHIEAADRATGVLVRVNGGGATLVHSLIPRSTFIQPDRYVISRRTISEPTRSYSDNRVGWWETPPAAPTDTRYLTTSGATTLAGVPTTTLPAVTPYTVPGDPSPPDDPSWEQIADVVNANKTSPTQDTGAASYLDTDVESGGVYEYVAVAVIAEDQSVDSNIARVTFSGTTPSRGVIVDARRNPYTDALEGDASPPDDPYYPEISYGEPVVFEVPALVGDDISVVGDGTWDGSGQWQPGLPDGFTSGGQPPEAEAPGAELTTIQELTAAIAERVFEAERPERLIVDLTVPMPLLGLRKWHDIITPAIEYDTHGGGITFTTTAAVTQWRLAGFTLTADKTVMRLVER